MCHASKEQQASFKTQTATTQAINEHLDSIFSNNENILGSLKEKFTPLIAAGAHQYAFDHSQDAALRNEAGAKAAGANALNATRMAAVSEGAGTSGVPAGSQDAVDAQLAESIAQKQNQYGNAVTAEGYRQGTENFGEASRILPGAANTLENQITNAGDLAQTAASGQSKSAQDITAANHAWIAPVASMFGATISGIQTKPNDPPKPTATNNDPTAPATWGEPG